MKLSLIQIAKGEKENLERLYPLVKDFIDEWVVVVPPKDDAIEYLKDKATVIEQDFTQGIEPEVIEQMRSFGLDVPEDYRLFNFSKARNASLEAATGDYILWLDADDEPVGMDNVKKLIEKHPEVDVFEAVYDYGVDEEGNPISDHVRERVVRNNGKFEWRGGKLGLIHETLLPKKTYNPLMLQVADDVFRVKHHSDHIDQSSVRNHIALLYEYIKTGGEDARTTLYLGIEFFNRRMFEYCIKVLLEYVKVGGSTEDRFNAWNKIGDAYRELGRPESARNAYLEAQKEMPNRPDSYLSIGETYFEEDEWVKCVEYMVTGLGKKMPVSKHAIDKLNYTFRPAGYIAQAYLQLGKPKEAYEWFKRAYQANPKHPWLKQYAKLFQDAKDLNDYVKAFVKLGQISQRLYPKTLPKLAAVIPDELMDQELLMDFRARYTPPKIWPNNSVVFYCSEAFEEWGPESLEKGCGGSEEAVIQLSKQLANLGWDVTVYNNCIKEGKFDGVNWVNFARFNPRDMFSVLVAWRHNRFVEDFTAMKKVVDVHDVPTEPAHYAEEHTKDVKIFVKSKYHRDLFPDLKDENFAIIPNGIDLSQFKKTKKTKNNLVWSSSYDRGLENLLEMWADIRSDVPEATLDVYYGFELFDSTPWGKKPSGQRWKAKMLQLLEQDGITHHGRVGTEEIAKAYLKADIWAYPTSFPEIDCITATKAMAAGAIPVATDFAVLPERNQGIEIKGDINKPEVKEEFKKQLISLMKDEDRKEEIRSMMDVAEYDWAEIAKKWDKEFKS